MYLTKPLTLSTKREMLPGLLKHEPRLEDVVVCDFCGNLDPVVIFAAHRMSTGVMRGCWRWCACATCQELAQSEEWEKLEERIIPKLSKLFEVQFGEGVPEQLLKQAVRRALKEFIYFAVKDGEL